MTQAPLGRTEDERLKCEIVYEMSQLGHSPYRCSKAAGVTSDTATRWLRNPTKYDPYLDEVAIRRAVSGDRAVWEMLSVWEMHVVYGQLNELRSKMFDFEWNEYAEALRKALGHKDSRIISRGMRIQRAA